MAANLPDTSFLQVFRPYWYFDRTPTVLGAIFLLSCRLFLFKNDLHDYNDPSVTSSLFSGNCTGDLLRFRSMDGRCNNLDQPWMGMVGTRFGKIALKNASIPEPGLLVPDPYLVAETFLTPKYKPGTDVPDRTNASALNLNIWATAWIQFMTHDWFHHTFDDSQPPISIQVGPSGKEGSVYKLAPSTVDSKGFARNNVTTWWDASQIYGSSEADLARVRRGGAAGSPSSSRGGASQASTCKLPLDSNNLIPLGPDGIPIQGFTENWWLGVELMHHLFVYEHNAICDALADRYPNMNVAERFHTARLIVAAVQAKIHTIEWTPALLQNRPLTEGMNINWKGIGVDFILRLFAQVPFQPVLQQHIGDLIQLTSVPGEKGVGDKTALFGSPMNMPEDFVSAYRMHELMPDFIPVPPLTGSGKADNLAVQDATFQNSRNVVNKFGLERLAKAFGLTPPGALVLNNYPAALTRLRLPSMTDPSEFINLAVIDVVRDRERGVPRYNQVRRQLGLTPLQTFEDLTDNPDVAAKLKSVYGDVELIDFHVGCAAESPRPSGYAFGQVPFFIFILQASRRLQTDRFFQEAFNKGSYTNLGLDWIEDATFKSVLARHFPEAAASIGSVSTAFYTWTKGQSSDGEDALGLLTAKGSEVLQVN